MDAGPCTLSGGIRVLRDGPAPLTLASLGRGASIAATAGVVLLRLRYAWCSRAWRRRQAGVFRLVTHRAPILLTLTVLQGSFRERAAVSWCISVGLRQGVKALIKLDSPLKLRPVTSLDGVAPRSSVRSRVELAGAVSSIVALLLMVWLEWQSIIGRITQIAGLMQPSLSVAFYFGLLLLMAVPGLLLGMVVAVLISKLYKHRIDPNTWVAEVLFGGSWIMCLAILFYLILRLAISLGYPVEMLGIVNPSPIESAQTDPVHRSA